MLKRNPIAVPLLKPVFGLEFDHSFPLEEFDQRAYRGIAQIDFRSISSEEISGIDSASTVSGIERHLPHEVFDTSRNATMASMIRFRAMSRDASSRCLPARSSKWIGGPK